MTSNKKSFITWFHSFPEIIRMGLVAILGVIIGFITYEFVFFINPINPKASSSWFIAFIIGIARQHGLHRWLTFETKTRYWPSLGRAYIMYSGSLVFSSGLNWVLTENLDMHHRLAWALCTLLTGMVSYVFLRRFVFQMHNQNN